MPGDEGVLEDKPGICPNPKCKMPLVPIRLDAKYWCPTHQTLVVRDGPGTCPLDKKTLVPVTLSEFWTCADKPDEKVLEPGNCANGQPRKIAYELRAHGDHNPRHGGQFFMAEDAWHHMEGTYPSAALFRAFFYDNYTKPMNPKAFSGSVIVLDKADKELGTFPLTVVARRRHARSEDSTGARRAALQGGREGQVRAGTARAAVRFQFRRVLERHGSARDAASRSRAKAGDHDGKHAGACAPRSGETRSADRGRKAGARTGGTDSSTRAGVTGTADSRQPDADSAGARRGARRIEAADEYAGAAR